MLTYLHKLRFSNGTRLAGVYARSFSGALTATPKNWLRRRLVVLCTALRCSISR